MDDDELTLSGWVCVISLVAFCVTLTLAAVAVDYSPANVERREERQRERFGETIWLGDPAEFGRKP